MGKKQQPALTTGNIRIHVISNARGQTEIDLSHQGLTYIPLQVFQFAHLEVLKLSNNALDTVPVMISYLRGLRILHLQHNVLTQLPETIINCRHLSEIDLTHNQMTTLPRGLAALKELRILKLGDNLLEQIPHEIGDMTNLRVLDLHGNHLWYLPFSAQNLHHLVRLDLSNNLFDQIPLVITKMPWLHALNMARNRLAALPPDFDQLRALEELNLSENHFVAMGMMVAKLRNLKYLSLAHNRLKFLPTQMTSLQNMRVLHLQGNALESLPDDFPHLRYLNMSKNNLVQFSVLHMTRLVTLDASSNKLLTVPQGLYCLHQLRILRLAHNNISELAEEICQLKKLHTLDLSDNNLCRLPASLHFMNKLTSFNVCGNDKINKNYLPAGADFSQKNKGKKALIQKSASMPSLHKAGLPDQNIDYTSLKDKAAVSLSTKDHNRLADTNQGAWLQQRELWDKNLTLRTAPSILYPLDTTQYYTAEMQTNLSAESEDSEDNSSTFHVPFSKQSFRSKLTDFGCQVSPCSDDDDNDQLRPNQNLQGGLQHSTMSRVPNRRSLRDLFCMTKSQSLEDVKSPHAQNDVHNHNIRDLSLKTNITSQHKPILDPSADDTTFSQPWRSEMNYINTKISSDNLKATEGTAPRFRSKTSQASEKHHKIIKHTTKQDIPGSLAEQPLTMQMWTQTQPSATNTHSTSTQTQLVLDSTQPLTNGTVPRSQSKKSPLWPATSHDNFIMRKLQLPSASQPSPGSQNIWTGTSGIQSSSDTTPYPSSGPKTRSLSHEGGPRMTGADYTLLGMCSQIQTKLHRDLLQPGMGYDGHSERFSDKTTGNEQGGTWHFSQAGTEVLAEGLLEGGLDYSPGETFTTSEHGGQYVSVFCPHVQVSVPPGAIASMLHVTLQQLTISPVLLEALSRINSQIVNIISLGPIIFLSSLEKIVFTSPVTMTIPSPPKVKGQQGHLLVVSICNDNSCIPCATGYQSSRHEVTLTSWHMTGKVAMYAKAKCKYKACKSMEQLLATLNLVTMKTSGQT